MDRTDWLKQTPGQPLFPDLLWSRPEQKAQAGKLLIVGGNLHGFAAPAEAYAVAEQAGVGIARVLLPDSLKKTVGRMLDNCLFTPSTPSGSFSQQALAEFLDQAAWADAVLVTGDLGRNSETAILLEKFLVKYQGLVTLTKDAVDYAVSNPQMIANRSQTTLVLTIAQLQKLVSALKYPQAVTFEMPLERLVNLLSDFSQSFELNLVLKYQLNMLVAVEGQVSVTRLSAEQELWRVSTAAKVTVWWLQNSQIAFKAMTSSLA